MTRWLSWLREAGRFTSFLVFQILILFWCVKAGYAAYGYFSKGGPGARQALLRHMSNPYDAREWSADPRWDIIALRYLAIALLTILFGLWSRPTFRKMWADIRPRRIMKPPHQPQSDTSSTTR